MTLLLVAEWTLSLKQNEPDSSCMHERHLFCISMNWREFWNSNVMLMHLSIPLLLLLSLTLHLLSLYPPLFLRYVFCLLPHSCLVIALSACHPKTTASFSISVRRDWRRKQQLTWRQPREKRNKNISTVYACCLYSMSIHPALCTHHYWKSWIYTRPPLVIKWIYITSTVFPVVTRPPSLLLSFYLSRLILFHFISSLALSMSVPPVCLFELFEFKIQVYLATLLGTSY